MDRYNNRIISRATTYHRQSLYNSKFECVKRAVFELVPVNVLRDTYTLYDMTLDDLVESIVPNIVD